MARCDVVVIGAGLGGLTAGAILARAGRKVLVIERSNSVGGAASSYKSGDLFIEGSLQETSDPRHPLDPKHDALTRAGVLDAVKWIPAGSLYEARGGPLEAPFVMPDNFDAARHALTERFPQARAGIDQLLGEMAAHRVGRGLARARRLGPDEFAGLAAVAVAEARCRVRRRRSGQMRCRRQPVVFSRRPRDVVVDPFRGGAGKLSAKRRAFRAGRIAAAVERAGPRHPHRRRRGAAAPRRHRHRA